jgi:hypothetical protein
MVLDSQTPQNQGLDCPYRPSGYHPTPAALARFRGNCLYFILSHGIVLWC